MTTKNPYRKNTRIEIRKCREIIKYFSYDLTAVTTAKLTWLSTNTIENWYNYFRESIYWYCENEKNELMKGEIEMDESYF